MSGSALVLGGSVLVGKHLVERLLGRDVHVAVLNRGRTPTALPSEVERLVADRTDGEQMRAALDGRDWDAVYDASGFVMAAGGSDIDGLLDLLATDQQISFEVLERIHRGKTGALFSASATAGALTAGANADVIGALSAFAKNLGLAFQIIDDLLDVEGDPADTGKTVRVDVKKTTFVSFSGVDGARLMARELCQTADRALSPFGRRADRLRELSAFVAGRNV